MSETYDLVIVGGGIAGLCAALGAPPDARIVVIDKGESAAGSSPLAQGGMAAAVGPGDSVELHARDTIAAGAGICDEGVVQDVCGEGPRAVMWLRDLGCAFDANPDGTLHLAREGGQSVARSVHWRDATGAEIVRALRTAVRDRNVERVHERAVSLAFHEGRCTGVVTADGAVRSAGAVLLATGGAGALWGITTNAAGAYGDGLALALRAGVQLADLEFMQFHPTALAAGDGQRCLLTEALRGHGATLVNDRGERFVDELAPRHVVTAAILAEERAFLDCRHIDALDELFPTVVAGAHMHGFDAASELLPVRPAAHYFIGGIAADAHGRTSAPGLYAAGECASTGMHGANRMAGNSLLETVVVGRRVGESVTTTRERSPAAPAALVPHERSAPDAGLVGLMWECAGPVRSDGGLARALAAFASMPESSYRYLCEMIVRAARARLESRGVHVREDFPDADAAFAVRSFDRWSRAGRFVQDA